MKIPLVSVVMITYAHENFIEQAINSILMQDCAFEVELIIANDCSPDNTDVFIRNIINNHPNSSWIKYINHEKNLGMMPNYISALQQCKGKYIAMCEGDDYWTDPYKLQKQVDFLEKNEDYSLCFHSTHILEPDGSINVNDFLEKMPDKYQTFEDLSIYGNYIQTASVIFRRTILPLPEIFNYSPAGDYPLWLYAASKGNVHYIPDTMAVYRRGVGVWSSLDEAKRSFNHCYVLFLCVAYYKEFKMEKGLQNQLDGFQTQIMQSSIRIAAKNKDDFSTDIPIKKIFFSLLKGILRKIKIVRK
jgi:glycosyltransferase involved in cell wall biosynthesis